MGAPYLLFKRKKSWSDIDTGREQSTPRLRTSAEISAAALDAYWEKLTTGTRGREQALPPLQTSYFLQNWRWYIREHWKQAVVTALCYLLTFLLWRRLT